MTDDTAKALIDFPQSVVDGKHNWDIPDLQAMAKLWLMRDEIELWLYSTSGGHRPANVPAEPSLYKRVKALENGK